MRSPISATTTTSRWWLTTTAAGWCGPHPGRDTATLRRFFDALGAERCAQITHVSADAADWIADVVAERRGHDEADRTVTMRRDSLRWAHPGMGGKIAVTSANGQRCGDDACARVENQVNYLGPTD